MRPALVTVCHRCPHMARPGPGLCTLDAARRDVALAHVDPPEACPSLSRLRGGVVAVVDPAERRAICMGCDEGGGGSPDGEWMACRLAVGGCGNRNPGQVKLTVGRCPLGKWERVSIDVRPSFDAAATGRERPVG